MIISNIFEQELAKSTVFKDRDLITPHYVPKTLPFRENQIKDISSILVETLRGKKSDNIFIYGKTGTGKTSTTKYVLQQLMEYAEKNSTDVQGIYINCRNHASKYRVLLKCCKEFYPDENFLGFSSGFVHEKLVDFVSESKKATVIILDEVDKIKDLDDLIYALTRSNDELNGGGSVTVIGISNNLLFKEKLDPRTKSSLCEKEMVFPPYNAEELKEILKQRIDIAFKEDSVSSSAVNLAAAFAAKESGDARTAVMLMLRAGEIADKTGKTRVIDEDVEKAKQKVEEEIIFNMISTLPTQEQLVLLSIAELSMKKTGIKKITGEEEKGVLYSGEVYEEYQITAKKHSENVVSSRWYRQYINELEMYGLIVTTNSGAGQRGQTRFIKLGYDPEKIKNSLEYELG